VTSLPKLVAATIAAFVPMSVFAQFYPPPQNVVPSDQAGNTAIGPYVLQNVQNSQGNTGAGEGALQADTTGFYNTSIGWDLLNLNTTGYQAMLEQSALARRHCSLQRILQGSPAQRSQAARST
jgi:hypothetical protein